MVTKAAPGSSFELVISLQAREGRETSPFPSPERKDLHLVVKPTLIILKHIDNLCIALKSSQKSSHYLLVTPDPVRATLS